jgi:hypothetical protein
VNNIKAIDVGGLLLSASAYTRIWASSTEWPSSSSHCLIPNILGVPFRSDSPFKRGIRLKSGKLLVGSMLGLGGRRLLFKTSRALCSKLDMANKINI